ncbi:MAG: 5'/3'-nucleotidase SurE [Candidatus Sumerlaeia bacterium]|nr:5'/3'-nucleotidase SurE [Candidatus Sumerlaeia bacterium]
MQVLLTNDDGIAAPGLAALIAALAPHAGVTVVAPEVERSAKSHAITVFRACRLTPHPERAPGGRAWSLDANPADCVKYALSSAFPGGPPALVISGINRGQNTGNNIIYSGTVAAAVEGAMYGCPAIAVSLAAQRTEEADFGLAAAFAVRLAQQVAQRGLPRGVVLNVNVPNLPPSAVRGAVWAKQGHARFTDHWAALPEDNPGGTDNGHRYVRNIGESMTLSHDDRDDDCLVARGFITVTPLTYDRTHHELYVNPPEFDLTL